MARSRPTLLNTRSRSILHMPGWYDVCQRYLRVSMSCDAGEFLVRLQLGWRVPSETATRLERYLVSTLCMQIIQPSPYSAAKTNKLFFTNPFSDEVNTHVLFLAARLVSLLKQNDESNDEPVKVGRSFPLLKRRSRMELYHRHFLSFYQQPNSSRNNPHRRPLVVCFDTVPCTR
uniref:(California timema) hypothetical protein n=1 Tax=Timema californicum TaxID=61474 RepID=A0A7R9JF78_TIMCA|nr:unnamed protein product [Timema californicum]